MDQRTKAIDKWRQDMKRKRKKVLPMPVRTEPLADLSIKVRQEIKDEIFRLAKAVGMSASEYSAQILEGNLEMED